MKVCPNPVFQRNPQSFFSAVLPWLKKLQTTLCPTQFSEGGLASTIKGSGRRLYLADDEFDEAYDAVLQAIYGYLTYPHNKFNIKGLIHFREMYIYFSAHVHLRIQESTGGRQLRCVTLGSKLNMLI